MACNYETIAKLFDFNSCSVIFRISKAKNKWRVFQQDKSNFFESYFMDALSAT